MFELVVVICLIVLLYMIAEDRLNELPAAAERAGFYGVLAQVKTGMNIEMMSRISRGAAPGARELEGANPMDFLLEVPGRYRGEVESVDDPALRRASWYYDRSREELVYLVGEESIQDVTLTVAGVEVNAGVIRFRVVSAYGRENSDSLLAQAGERQGGLQALRDREVSGSWQGLLLLPVYPFEWEQRAETPVDISTG